MSYLNKTNVPLINSKITAIGRQKIAEGNLNFKYFALGDSQVDYSNVGSQNILKPKDKNPNVKTFLTKSDCNPFQLIDGVKVLECCIHNRAKERGFFDEENDYNLKIANNKIIKYNGQVYSQQLNGSKLINIQTSQFKEGDFIVFKIANPSTGYLTPEETNTPVPYVFFQISKTPTSTIVELDRNLPYLDYSDLLINFYIFSNDIEDYKSTNVNSLWDYEQLKFKIECLNEDTYVWNLNIIWGENVIGTKPNEQQYQDYCSWDFIGQKEYFGYNVDCPDNIPVDCEDKLLGIDEDFIKSIGIIHYTNTNKTNLYGEQFYLKATTDFKLHLKTLMWHRRYFVSGSGDTMGMIFVTDTTQKFITNTNIEYYNLIEDATLINPNDTPLVVGRIFPALEVVVIHHPDLLAALSYKSNRNFTLPKLKGKMISPSTPTTGVLAKGKTMYITYTMESHHKMQHILPMQQYLKFVNTTSASKDIEFYLETGYLPYMRQEESMGYDGLGFSFHRFKVLYQIVDNGVMPKSDAWKGISYTNNFLVDFIGNTINPTKLQTQNSASTGFIINNAKIASALDYDLIVLNIPNEVCPNVMGFGCEVVLFGNIDVEIGTCVYKSVIEIQLDSDLVVKSTNPTWNNTNLNLSEIGIYDDKYNLVWYNSFFEQISIAENSKTLIELQMDF